MPEPAALAILFAGGAGQRMGGADKGALSLGGESLAARMLARLSTEAEAVAVSGRTKPGWLEGQAAAFIADIEGLGENGLGPAGGLLSAMEWTEARYPADALVFTAPIDVPFYPQGLAARMSAAIGTAPGIIVRQGEWLHPVFGLWRAGAAARIRHLVTVDKIRAMHTLADRCGADLLDVEPGGNAFLNINTPEDLARAEALLGVEGSNPRMKDGPLKQ